MEPVNDLIWQLRNGNGQPDFLQEAAYKIANLRDLLATSERAREHSNRELAKDSALINQLQAQIIRLWCRSDDGPRFDQQN